MGPKGKKVNFQVVILTETSGLVFLLLFPPITPYGVGILSLVRVSCNEGIISGQQSADMVRNSCRSQSIAEDSGPSFRMAGVVIANRDIRQRNGIKYLLYYSRCHGVQLFRTVR